MYSKETGEHLQKFLPNLMILRIRDTNQSRFP